MTLRRREFTVFAAAYLAGCTSNKVVGGATNEIYDVFAEDFYKFVDLRQSFDVLGSGFGWAEGPAWDKDRNRLYFTDVPGNQAFSWSESRGVETFLKPSGSAATNGFREPGANGLLYAKTDHLLLCNHGERSVQSLNVVSKSRTTLAQSYQGKKFNSPNDIIQSKRGDIYFTDPPYGLTGLNQSPLKEIDFNGVYRVDNSGKLTALITDMTFPNGVALSPDQNTLYVSQSDPDAPHLYALDLSEPGARKRLLVDLGEFTGNDYPGLPDGMVIDYTGHIFATGPGGVFVISPNGEVLGRIKTGKASANCTFGEDGSTLFITNHDRLIKLKTKTRGLAWTS